VTNDKRCEQAMLQRQGEEHGCALSTRLRSVEQETSSTARQENVSSTWTSTFSSRRTIAIALAFISLIVTAHSYGDQTYIAQGMLWMREHEQQGRVWFVVAYTACLLLLLPASVLALFAGAV
jgi:hypothetical protein